MRIAIITTDLRDDHRRHTEPAPSFGAAPAALLQGLAGLDGCEIHIVSCAQRPVASPAKLAANIHYHSVTVGKWGWMRGGYAGCVMAVRRKLREIQPDIVHGQGTERYCALSAAFSGFPNVVTVHGKMTEISRLFGNRIGSFNWLAARVEDFTLPKTGGIICISDYVKNLVEKYKVPTWFVPNAIQRMFFDFPKGQDLPPTAPLLINVGVVCERKRQQELLEALVELREEGVKFEALFVGLSNPQAAYAVRFQEMLDAAGARLGGFSHVKSLDEASFCRLYDRASAMIHFSSEESFGLVFAEAIARNLYLFASDVGSIKDIAMGVERVRIFDMHDWKGMKDAVRQWIVSGGPGQPRPEAPPPEFVARYHPRGVAARHVEIYREVLGNQKA